jgi:hypothetical protein
VSLDATNAWHDLLDDELAAESVAWLDARQRERGIVFGDRPLCTVVRPRFFTPAAYDHLRTACRDLLTAFRVIGEAALTDRSVRAAFRLADWEESLLERLPRAPCLNPLGRIDAFIDPVDGVAHVTEFNGETPAGASYTDLLSDCFLALPATRQFIADWVLRPLPAQPSLLTVVLESWHRATGSRAIPTVAIVDWADVPTHSEFVIARDYFRSMGVPTLITTPEALEYRGGVLRNSDGTVIDVVYKRVLLHELVAKLGQETPLLQAVADGAVVMVNPVHGKPLHKKASLAVLTDERTAHLLSPEQHQTVARHVPWTRVIEERTTIIDGETIDLLPWMVAHRQELVIKPNDDYGGIGIVLGWDTGDAEWEAAMRIALERPCVVQRRIALPSEPFPTVVDGKLVIDQRIVDTAPFCWWGSWVDGVLTRISTSPLVNVTSGGGSTVPTFVVEPRG